MKELRKNFRRKMALQLLAVVVCYFLITIGYDLFVGNRLTDTVSHRTVNGITSQDLSYQIESDGGMIQVENLWVENAQIHYTVRGTVPGRVYLIVRYPGSDAMAAAELLEVAANGSVRNVYTGNFPNCRFHLLANVVLLTLFEALCLVNLLRYREKLPYSYELMFVGGLLIWLTCTIIIQWYSYLHYDFVFDYYIHLQKSAYQFMLYTAPVVWIFCIALSVSNVSLIRHEGYRPVNALGIFLSVFLMIGSLAGIAANNLFYVKDPALIRMLNIGLSSYCSIYALFACLLEGAVIGGIAAARHIPSMDCDYIIILGCMIRKDGSLTPLLRGRVDRAIAHGRQQEQTTGKKVIYVPSGGQGRNEVMPEGEAMKQYLLSQGIPEEQVLVEDKSRNTAENMLYSRRLIEAQKPDARIAFSTTNYHVFRSGIIATQKDFCPEGMGSRTKWYFWPNAFIREFLGMVMYTRFTIAGILVTLVSLFAVIEAMITR